MRTQNGLVFIAVIYEAYEANFENPSFTDSSYVQAFLEVPDNGCYTVTPNKMTDLPSGSIVSIGVVRTNYQMMTDLHLMYKRWFVR